MSKFLLDICSYNQSDMIAETQKDLGLSPQEIYDTPENIKKLALLIKKQRCHSYCSLPFCHTLEAETLGANINLGDEFAGPRSGKPIFESVFDIEVSKNIQKCKRAQNMIKTCEMLVKQGEQVRFSVATPFNIAGCLVDTKVVFKEWRKRPSEFYRKLNSLACVAFDMAKSAVEAGACAINIIDGPTAVAIVGEKKAIEINENFTQEFVCNIAEIVGENVAVYLCPICLRTDIKYPKNVVFMKDCPGALESLG